MAGLPQAYAANPRQLDNPVPGATQKDALDKALAATPPPPAQPSAGQAPPKGGDALDQALAGTPSLAGAQAPQQDAQSAPAQQAPQEQPQQAVQGNGGFADQAMQFAKDAVTKTKDEWRKIRSGDYSDIDRNPVGFGAAFPGAEKFIVSTLLNNTVNLDQQVSDYPLKHEVNRGANDNEKIRTAQKYLGADNVRTTENGTQFRYPGDKTWRNLSQPGLELMTDTVGNTRQMTKEMVLAPAEFVGGVAGSLVGQPTAGTFIGRAAMEPLANKAADYMFGKQTGLSPDEGRNKLVENITDGALDLLAPFMQYQISKKIPGTAAWASRMDRTVSETAVPSKLVGEQIAAAQRLEASGVVQRVPGEQISPDLKGTTIGLSLDQMRPNDPKVLAMKGNAVNEAAYVNAKTAQAQSVLDAVHTTLNQATGFSGEDPASLVEKLGSTVKMLDQTEGKAIASYRAKAMAELGNQKLPVPDALHQQASEMMNQLGFIARPNATNTAIEYVPPTDMRPLMGKFGITKMGDMRSFVNALQDYAEASNGGMRISDIDQLTTSLGALNPTARRAGGPVSQAWGQFTSDLRDFRRSAIKAGLGNDVDAKGFDAVMDRFSDIRKNSGALQDLLQGDFTAGTVSKQIFSRGKDGLADLRAVKALTMNDAPETWAALKSQWIDDMLTRHTRDTGVGFNYLGMQKELSQYGDTFLNEAFEGSGMDRSQLNDLMNYGRLLQKTFVEPGAGRTVGQQADKALIDSGIGLLGKMRFKTVNGVERLLGIGAQGNPLNTLLDPGKIEEYVSKYPGRIDKQLAVDNLKRIIGTGKLKAILPVAISAARRGATTGVQQATKNAVTGSPAVSPDEGDDQ